MMTSLYGRQTRFSNTGFSLMEFLISLAIISIAGFIILPTITNQFKTLNRLADGGICEAFLKESLANLHKYRMLDSETSNFIHPQKNLGPGRAAGDPAFKIPSNPPELAARFKRYPGLTTSEITELYEQNPKLSTATDDYEHNGITLYTPLLTNTEMGYLADLYSSNRFIRKDFVDFPADGKLNPKVANTNAQFKDKVKYNFNGQIKIELYRLDDNQIVPPLDRFFPRPRNQYLRSIIYHPASAGPVMIGRYPDWLRDDLGFLVSLQGQVMTKENQVLLSECSIKEKFSYPMDFHNVLDFFKDLRVTAAPTYTPSFFSAPFSTNPEIKDLKDFTPLLSNKNDYASLKNDFRPIFTNLATDASGKIIPKQLRERDICTQDGRKFPDFHLKLRIEHFDKESGVVPMCMDTSTQWLSNQSQGWCPSGPGYNNVDARSEVHVNYDWKPGGTGWVPCEQMKFCGQEPDQVIVTNPNNDTVEYQFHYRNVFADNNTARRNRLWGCEMKYLVAALDPSGNLLYPPVPLNPSAPFLLDQDGNKVTSSALGMAPAAVYDKDLRKGVATASVVPNQIREVNPRIYFKPPPCYTCECKACKKGKGGFLGSFFKILVLVALVAATGVAWYWAVAIEITSGLATMAALCANGQLGCESGGNSTPANITTAGKYRSCKDDDNGCKCGHKCDLKRAPAPSWVDSLSGMNPDALAASLAALSCKAGEKIPITVDGYSFTLTTGYRSPGSATSPGKIDEQTPVLPYDEISTQQFFPKDGKFCVATYYCDPGSGNGNSTWKPKLEDFYDEGNVNRTDEPIQGCFDVKVGHHIVWDTNLPDPNKPKLGGEKCLEVNFNRNPFNGTGEPLASYASLTHECGQDTADETQPPKPISTTASKRLVGRAMSGECPQDITVAGLGTVRPAVGIVVPNTTSAGPTGTTSSFLCWTRCQPPLFMPSGPMTNNEQLYYESYSAANGGLPFCTLDKSTFDPP